jgi:hypothetical protein
MAASRALRHRPRALDLDHSSSAAAARRWCMAYSAPNGEPMRVASEDRSGHDELFRFQESVQLVFDVAGSVERAVAQ